MAGLVGVAVAFGLHLTFSAVLGGGYVYLAYGIPIGFMGRARAATPRLGGTWPFAVSDDHVVVLTARRVWMWSAKSDRMNRGVISRVVDSPLGFIPFGDLSAVSNDAGVI